MSATSVYSSSKNGFMDRVDWIGSIGVFQILLAYVLNMLGKLNKGDLTFILLNLVGAGMACLASILMHYMPFIILEGVWALVSLISLLQFKWKSKKKTFIKSIFFF